MNYFGGFILFLFTHCAFSQIPQQIQNNDAVIDNDIIILKLDMTRGGAISYLSPSNSTRSLVNIADKGRYMRGRNK